MSSWRDGARWTCQSCGARARNPHRPPSGWRDFVCSDCQRRRREGTRAQATAQVAPRPAAAHQPRRPAVAVVRDALTTARPGMTVARIVATSGLSPASVKRALRELGATGTAAGQAKVWRLDGATEVTA